MTFPLEVINKFLITCAEKYGALKLPESINHSVFLGEVQQFVQENVAGISKNDLDTRELNSLSATVYLLMGILIEGKTENLQKGFTINLKTEMSVGAGLGSSASFGVCLAAAFYFLVRYF